MSCCSNTISPFHPLQPLSNIEVQEVVKILKENLLLNSSIRIISIFLKEPHKSLILNRNASTLERIASVILYDRSNNSSHDYLIDLNLKKVIAVEHAKSGSQPLYTSDEMFECEQTVLEDASFKAALKKHYDIDDTKFVMVRNLNSCDHNNVNIIIYFQG
jgi:Cu2+-containing amine oxidase